MTLPYNGVYAKLQFITLYHIDEGQWNSYRIVK